MPRDRLIRFCCQTGAVGGTLSSSSASARKHGWRLTPAYDMNPVPTDIKPRVLTTAVAAWRTEAAGLGRSSPEIDRMAARAGADTPGLT
jgi:hypothetical protein